MLDPVADQPKSVQLGEDVARIAAGPAVNDEPVIAIP